MYIINFTEMLNHKIHDSVYIWTCEHVNLSECVVCQHLLIYVWIHAPAHTCDFYACVSVSHLDVYLSMWVSWHMLINVCVCECVQTWKNVYVYKPERHVYYVSGCVTMHEPIVCVRKCLLIVCIHTCISECVAFSFDVYLSMWICEHMPACLCENISECVVYMSAHVYKCVHMWLCGHLEACLHV